MKICFVAHAVYPFFFSGAGKGQIGGAELQQKLIGEALAAKGLRVSFISLDVGQPDLTEKNGLVFVKTYKPDAGCPGVKFLYPRLTKTWKALKKADADIYYVRGAGFLAGLLAAFCRIHKKKFIFAAASDSDLIPGREMVHLARDRWLFRMGIRRASCIIAQSECQRELLQKNYGLNSTLIRNYFKMQPRQFCQSRGDIILWVSTIRSLKRPFEFLELANKFPHERFVMIGGPDSNETDLYERLRERCAETPNLDFLGLLPLDKTEKYFDRCKVFVNTSEFEGFPNTFLQAWGRGIPVISHVDPDGIIGKYGLGFSVDHDKPMCEALAHIMTLPLEEYHARITEYFKNTHSNGIIEKYCSTFGRLCSAK